MKHLLLGVCGLAILMGCAGGSREDLRDEYSKTAREIGLFPIYPPREDFQIGDIYMASANRQKFEDLEYVRVGRLEKIRNLARLELNKLIAFDNSDIEENKINAKSQSDFDIGFLTTRGEVAADAGKQVKSLPIVAFPKITANAGLTAGVGLTGLLESLGFGSARNTTVTLEFPDVRTYGVSKVEARKYRPDILANSWANIDEGNYALQRQIILGRDKAEKAAGPTRCVNMSMITQVYLTRQIVYTYSNAEILAVGLKRAEPGGTVSEVSTAPQADINLVAALTANSTNPPATAAALKSITDDFSQQSGKPGQSIQFQSWDGRGLSFSQTFQRPVVIGWDGYDIRLPSSVNAAKRAYGKASKLTSAQVKAARQDFDKSALEALRLEIGKSKIMTAQEIIQNQNYVDTLKDTLTPLTRAALLNYCDLLDYARR